MSSTPIASAGVWRVGALLQAVGEMVGRGFSSCTVAGEVSNFSRAASGHCYFNLKDPEAGAMLRCAMFRRAAQLSAFVPEDGAAVELRGRLAVYEPRGELQLIVEAARRSGAGALYERFLRLKALLEAEGLFDPATRRPMPAHPSAIGIVTSLAGAALHDVQATLARRSPHVQLVVYPSVVQGVDAPKALCEAITLASRRNEVDVLLVCRGGGSLEDLWSFNDERVVRAIKASPIPVVCGVGHETDITLADLAADLRAPTPTAAAELVAPSASQSRAALDALAVALQRRVGAAIDRQSQRLDRASQRLAAPSEGLRRRALALELVAQRLGSARAMASARLARRLESAAHRLAAVDPHRVLARGYALLQDEDGIPITSARDMRRGDAIRAALHDGKVDLRVESEPAA